MIFCICKGKRRVKSSEKKKIVRQNIISVDVVGPPRNVLMNNFLAALLFGS